MFAGVRGPRYRRNKQVLLGNWSFVMEKFDSTLDSTFDSCQTFLVGKEDAVLLELSKGQEGQLPNIRTILPSILTVPRYLRAQPSWYTSTVTEIMSDHS